MRGGVYFIADFFTFFVVLFLCFILDLIFFPVICSFQGVSGWKLDKNVSKTRQAQKPNSYRVKHLLLVSIEACGNICVHISAKRLYKAASSFAECFENFYKEGIIEEDLSAKLRSMARFRNILVHRYWETDDKKILDYARNNLGDFDQFLKAIVKYLGIQP